MDSRLDARLQKWNDQLDVLSKIETEYFELEGEEKALEGTLYLRVKEGTVSEREARAYSSDDWKIFKRDLARKKAEYNKERRILELRIKAFESEYLTYKLESDIIRKGHGGQL